MERRHVPQLQYQIQERIHPDSAAPVRGGMRCRPRCVATATWLAALLAAFMPLAGCSNDPVVRERVPLSEPTSEAEDGLTVPGTATWVESGIWVRAGEPISISARGSIQYGAEGTVGPEGTYHFRDANADKPFPLPSAKGGPAPCYSLIGRIGDGAPFFIGRRRSWTAQATGPLLLGINDFDVSDNSGAFAVTVHKTQSVQPIGFEQVIPTVRGSGRPVANASVVVFYVDGLRPDVVREMCAMGHLPNINRVFVEGGTWLSHAYTAFPSDTITSNGTMWTGCFSDRHGLKGQVRFSRRSLYSESYLEPLGPHRSASLLAPRGIEGLVSDAAEATLDWTAGRDTARRWSGARQSGIPPLPQHLATRGQTWGTGILPMMTEVPPVLWTRSLIRQMPYLHAHEAWKYIDDANTHYAVNHLLSGDQPVTILWLPETDSISHKQSRGQFGVTRRTIAETDILIGHVVERLQALGRLEQTYLMLVSDHGHHGGRHTRLAHFDLANELFHKPREVTSDGQWIGGGFGMSVRQHRFWNRHEGDSSREFVFLDGDSDGAARIFLPRGHYRSNDWTGPERPGALLAYRISDAHAPLNLVDSLATTRAVHSDGSIRYPVDLVLLRVDPQTLLISTADRGKAVIHRKRNSEGQWVYRYTPVAGVQPTAEARVRWRVLVHPEADPLGILAAHPIDVLNDYHDEQTWLQMSVRTPYPDGVVALTRHMLWQENLRWRESEFAPDLVVTARPGWYFGSEATPGTTHGYPFHDSTRACWFVSGPNIRRGTRIDEPCRLADLTPTILDLLGSEDLQEFDFDGRPVTAIYEADEEIVRVSAQAVGWNQIDLQSWNPLAYDPLTQYEHLPRSVNQPERGFDLNNVVYNVMTLGDIAVLRLFDEVLFPLSSEGVVEPAVAGLERDARASRQPWLAEGVAALNLGGLAVSDYSFTSGGNLQRASGLIDWTQYRIRDAAVALTGDESPVLRQLETVGRGVDAVQAGFWETYRFGQRLVMSVLDERILNGIENRTDRVINSFDKVPSESLVTDPEQLPGRASPDTPVLQPVPAH